MATPPDPPDEEHRDPCPEYHHRNPDGASWLYGLCRKCKTVVAYTPVASKESDQCPECGYDLIFKKLSPPYFLVNAEHDQTVSLETREGLSGYIVPRESWEYGWHMDQFIDPNDLQYYIRNEVE